MSVLLWVAVAWLALGVLVWSWLIAAARGDRVQVSRSRKPLQRRSRSHR